MALMRVALIGVPSSAGGRRTGQDLAPAALRNAGLRERLQAGGLDVADFDDLPPVRFRPDTGQPRRQNLPLVVDVAGQVAELVSRSLAEERVPVVVGGDCSLSLGVIAGVLRHRTRPHLVYFDADLDLNTPATTLSGIFDGMVLAHALGSGVPELAGMGPRQPMLTDADVTLFGYDVESGWIDPYEIEVLNRSSMSRYPLSVVRDDPVSAARTVLDELNDRPGGLDDRKDGLIVHFDVDVTNIPAVDVPHPGGLDIGSACSALRVLVGAPNCAAVVVTEFNAELDPEGVHAEALVDGLVRALAP